MCDECYTDADIRATHGPRTRRRPEGMIPKAQFRRAVERFERATRCLKCARAAGPRERANILFEYRDAKRSLLDLGTLLITNELPMRSLGPDKRSEQSGSCRTINFKRGSVTTMSQDLYGKSERRHNSKPKTPEGAR